MFRLAVAGAGVVLLCAAAYVMGRQPGLPFGSEAWFMALLSAPALLVSLVAAVAAFRAAAGAAKLKRDVILLARSIDLALKEIVARSDRNVAALAELSAAVARDIEQLSGRIGERQGGGTPPALDNVIPHPSMRRSRNAGRPSAEQSTALLDPGAVASACRKAIARGQFDLALQPIVSASTNAAAGFEVFASLPLEGGTHVELRHPVETAARGEAAAFERILITTALQAARRRLGAASAAMPLHVAVSDALLADSKALGAVLDMLQFYPDLAGCLVLSMPHALLGGGGAHAQALDLIAAKGVRFAAEGGTDEAEAGSPRAAAGLRFLKVTASRLLDREQANPHSLSGRSMAEWAAIEKLEIIATGVGTDEDVTGLLDLGVDLMSGPRFGGPKRLRPEGAEIARGKPARV